MKLERVRKLCYNYREDAVIIVPIPTFWLLGLLTESILEVTNCPDKL